VADCRFLLLLIRFLLVVVLVSILWFVMPRSISNLELKQLCNVGGRGGRLSVQCNESLWTFNLRTTMITLSSEDVNVGVGMKCEYEDSKTDDSDDDGYESSSSDESLVDSETSVPVAPPMTGHRLLHLTREIRKVPS